MTSLKILFGFAALLAASSLNSALALPLEDLIRSGALPQYPQKPLSVTPLLDRIVDGPTQTTVFLTQRKSRTRTPMHTHDVGGVTCLLKGEMSLYVEGEKRLRVRAPGCYYMPSGKKMIGYNSGDSTAVFYDMFEGHIGFQYWSVHESGGGSGHDVPFGE